MTQFIPTTLSKIKLLGETEFLVVRSHEIVHMRIEGDNYEFWNADHEEWVTWTAMERSIAKEPVEFFIINKESK